MFCENCGQELKDNAKFCENCGTKVPQMRPESEVQAEQAQQENVYAQGAVQTEAPQENWQSQEAPQDTAAEPRRSRAGRTRTQPSRSRALPRAVSAVCRREAVILKISL